jgi:hypothetical protein
VSSLRVDEQTVRGKKKIKGHEWSGFRTNKRQWPLKEAFYELDVKGGQ